MALSEFKAIRPLLYLLCAIVFLLFPHSKLKAQLTQREAYRLSVYKKIDSLKADRSPKYEAHQMNNWAMIGQLYVRLGGYDSAARYFKLNYENTKVKQYDHFLNTLTVLDLAKVLKRQGYFLQALNVLESQPDERIESYRIDLRAERFLLVSSCCISTGELVRSYQNWRKANELLKKESSPQLDAMLYFTKGLILGTTEVNKFITQSFTIAAMIGGQSAVGTQRIDHLLCLASAKLYGNRDVSRDSLLILAKKEIDAGLDSSFEADMLELQFRINYHKRDMSAASKDARNLVNLARRYGLKYLEGIGYMYLSRNGDSKALRGYQLDTAIAIFRTCNHLNALKIAIHEHFDYYASREAQRDYILANYEEHYKLVEKWEDEQSKVEHDFLGDELTALDDQLAASQAIKLQTQYFAAGLAVLIVVLVLGLLYYRTQFRKGQAQIQHSALLASDMGLQVQKLQDQLNELTTQSLKEEHQKETEGLLNELEDVKSLVESRELLLYTIEENLRTNPQFAKQIDRLKQSLTQDLESNSWSQLISLFEDQKPNFNRKLLKLAPDLTPLDQKICAFLALDLDTRTIAQMLNVTEASLLNRRSAIRKKLSLDRGVDLQTYLMKL